MKKQSKSEQAYQLMKDAIISCQYPPGSQIAQYELVEKYNLGSTPMREALQRLTQEGLVTPIPRFGYMVTHVTLEDVHEMFELRVILESSAAGLAAKRGSEQEIQEIADHAQFVYVHGDRASYVDFLTRNAEFHRMVAAASGNSRLEERISTVIDELMRVFHFGLDLKDSAQEMRQEHLDLVAALQARDEAAAREIVRQQIEASRTRVIQALTQRFGSQGSQPPLTLGPS